MSGYSTVNDFKLLKENKKDHLINQKTKANYFNRVHVPKIGKTEDGEEHGVWKALWNNNIRMSKDSVLKKTEDDNMDGVFRCLSICLLLGELIFETDNSKQ